MKNENYIARKEYYESLRETLELLDDSHCDINSKLDALRRTIEGLIKDRELALEPYFLLDEQVNNLTDLVLDLSERS
ncbi:hypothetical protein [Psychroserpens sp.]|uniref:hypothetical protein n=1 Tax=Psychroserpens sp. TaxID=2020870 RepID=UPI003C73BB6F